MANIIGEPLETYVINQINARQKLHGSGVGYAGNPRTDTQINLLNSNTSWVKLASGVSVSSSRLEQIGIKDSIYAGMGLAKEFILFGGTSHMGKSINPVTGEEVDKVTQRTGFLPQVPVNGNPDNYSSYTFSRQGYVPMPGITNTEIKTLNRGSLKKANVRFKVHSREQFEIIDLLYLRLGYTVLLEWGNSIYTPDGESKSVVRNTLLEKLFFNLQGGSSYLDILAPIEATRAQYAGNYDGLLGKVSNFDWSYQPDGSYDINLTIISLGDVVESLKLNLSTDKDSSAFIQQVESLSPPTSADPPSTPNNVEGNKDSNLLSFMLWAWKYSNRNNIKDKYGEINVLVKDTAGNISETIPCGSFLVNDNSSLTSTSTEYRFLLTTIDARTSTLSGLENNGWILYDESTFTQRDENITSTITYKYFYKDKTYSKDQIDNGEIFEYKRQLKDTYGGDISGNIKHRKKTSPNTTSIPNPNTDASNKDAIVFNNTTPQYYIRFGYILSFIRTKIIPVISTPNLGVNTPIFDIDDDTYDNKMYSLPNQISLDPTVCVVRNNKFLKREGVVTDVFTQLTPFRVADFNSNGNINAAYPMNIYLNFDFVQSSLDSNMDERGDVNIYGFLSAICTGLNKALGGINNLEPVIDENTNTLKIIDTTPIPGLTKDTSDRYTLQLYGYVHDNIKNIKNGVNYRSNFIRNIDLKTAITPEYATMITVGATAGGYVKGTEATAFSRWNTGLTDRFKETLLPGNENSIPPTSTADEAEVNYVEKFLNKFGECYGYKGDFKGGGTANTEISSDIVSSNISVVTEYYKYLQSKHKSGGGGGTVGFIPFKLGLTMDGLSGIKIYNKLHVETKFLPSNYDRELDLIVTGVSHKLQNNDWETQIEATVIPKTSEISDLTIDYTAIQETTNNVLNEKVYPIPTSKKNIIEKIVSLSRKNGINDKERLTCILAVAGGETQWNVGKSESFQYSLLRAREVFPSYIPKNDTQALTYIPKSKGGTGSEEKLANLVYGKRFGNSANEGWVYRGRGLTQLTFKGNYELVQKEILSKTQPSTDIITNPNLVLNEDTSVAILVYGKIKALFGDPLIPNDPAYLTDPVRIQATQNGTKGQGKRRVSPVTPNYARALKQIEITSWVQDLIK